MRDVVQKNVKGNNWRIEWRDVDPENALGH